MDTRKAIPLTYSLMIHSLLWVSTRLSLSFLPESQAQLADYFVPGPSRPSLQVVLGEIPPPPPQKKNLRTSIPTTKTLEGAAVKSPSTSLPIATSGASVQLAQPLYPRDSRRLGEQGSVTLMVQRGQNSLEFEFIVKKSSGFSRLDQAALQALKAQSTFQLSLLKEVTYTFELSDLE